MENITVAALSGLLVSIPAVYFLKFYAVRVGMVVSPRSDRWHVRPVPLLGGVAIVVSTLVPTFLLTGWNVSLLWLAGAALVVSVLGLIDDRRTLRASTKLVVQLAVASALVSAGFVPELTPFQIGDILIAMFWIVGVTNAFNLLDNMDGLCAGIGTIAVVAFVAGSLASGGSASPEMVYASSLAGAMVGFLLFNFSPASIFMGDTGSLFIGVSLAGLTLSPGTPIGSNVLTVIAVPSLILAIPIFDTTFVTLSRRFSGRPASQGGRDHTSHRLVALGFSERGAVLLLYCLGGASGVLGVLVRQFGIGPVNVIVALLVVLLLLIGVRLANVKVYEKQDLEQLTKSRLTPLLATLMYKRRLFEIALDCLLVAVAYYAAFSIRFEGLNESDFQVYYAAFLRSLPIILSCKIVSFLVAGVYGGSWRYFSLSDLSIYLQGLVLGFLTSIVAVLSVFRFEGFSRGVFVIDLMLFTLLVLGSRISFRFLRVVAQTGNDRGKRTLVYGAGAAGAMVVRELINNETYKFLPIGFIDDNSDLADHRIQGYNVLGGLSVLANLIPRYDIKAIILSTSALDATQLEQLRKICLASNTELARFEFKFDRLLAMK